MIGVSIRICVRCGNEVIGVTEKYLKKRGNVCIICHRKDNLKWSRENRDKRHEQFLKSYYKDVDLTRAKNRENGKIVRHRSRMKLINLLGGKCIRCGFSDWRALQIDHVNGDGKADRLRFKSDMMGYYMHIRKEVINGSKDFQLLCANCNWIKKYEQNENGGLIKDTT